MKILLVGYGSREHVIAETFMRSTYDVKLYCIGNIVNPGIKKLCNESGGEYIRGKITNPQEVAKVAQDKKVDLVFIGPEEPNFHGVPDEVEEREIPCIGAKKKVALIEMSKALMRDIQWKYKIPGRLWYKKFRSYEEAEPYIREYSSSIALKPARQAGGKGVKVIEDFQVYLQEEKRELKAIHAKEIVEKYMKNYDDIDYKLLIEERVWGPEYTIQCFTDGRTVKAMPAVQDNKHAFNGDLGPETGGMGSISCGLNLKWGIDSDLSILTEEEYWRSVEIVEMMVKAIQNETGERYHGVVAGQMMLTSIWGPTIIEMYSRFGDPEAVNVLPLLKTDLVEICNAIIDEKLNRIKIEFEEHATVVKAVAPEGYPEKRQLAKGHPISVDEHAISNEGVKMYWGSVDIVNGHYVTGGSRCVEFLGVADEIPKASMVAEKGVRYVKLLDGWKLFHRSDIGSEKSLKRRIELGELARKIYKYRESRRLLGKRMIWIPGKGLIKEG